MKPAKAFGGVRILFTDLRQLCQEKKIDTMRQNLTEIKNPPNSNFLEKMKKLLIKKSMSVWKYYTDHMHSPGYRITLILKK